MSLEEIARSTKISIFYLQAIESGQIHKLPGAVYTRSYVRQYARAIDYCEEDLLASYGIAGEPEQAAHEEPRLSAPVRWFRFMTEMLHLRSMEAGAKRTG